MNTIPHDGGANESGRTVQAIGGLECGDGCAMLRIRDDQAHRRSANVFFISEFGERYTFTFERFQLALDRLSTRINRGARPDRPLRPHYVLERIENVTISDLRQAIDEAIDRSILFIADITPREETGGGASRVFWNPNVMYEIGRAQQARAPVFVICDRRYNPDQSKVALPFDLGTIHIHWYDFTPDGLKLLCDVCTNWLNTTQIAERYHQCKGFIDKARDIRNSMMKWPPDRHQQFIPLLAALGDSIHETVQSIGHHLEQKRTFRFRPEEPGSMIDKLFAGTILRLKEGDEYLAISTVTFWSELGFNPQFFAASREALENKVSIKRVFLVPTRGVRLTERDRLSMVHHLSEHAALEKRYPEHYTVRCLPHKRRVQYDDPAHCGVCVRRVSEKGFEVTAFRPTYRDVADGGRERQGVLVGIDYESNADARRRTFDDYWSRKEAVTLDEYLASSKGRKGSSRSDRRK